MALNSEQQAIEAISRAKNILVVTKEFPTIDAVAAAASVGLLLTKLHKPYDIVISKWDGKALPSFLPKTEIRSEFGAMQSFHLRLNVSATPLAELSYDVKDGMLDVALVPKAGHWTPADLTFKTGEDRYDLVIALDTPDLNSLGEIARTNADFFYRTTIINIDCQPSNEFWGQINLIDLSAVSTTEVLYQWFLGWNKTMIEESMATALLSGMISKTKSFRTTNVTPKTLASSSALISLGGDREKIVHGLWRNRTLGTLKLWGYALSRLEQDRDLGLVWSTLTASDFLEAGATPADLDGVVDDLLSYVPEAKVVALISQEKTGLLVSLHAVPPFSAADLSRAFNGHGTRERAMFAFPAQTLVEGTAQIVERLKQVLKVVK